MQKAWPALLLIVSLVAPHGAFGYANHVSLLFVAAATDNSDLIQYFGTVPGLEDRAIIHSVFSGYENGRSWVISAEPYYGVVKWPRAEFMRKYGRLPALEIVDAEFIDDSDQALGNQAFEEAEKYIGYPYNPQFNSGMVSSSFYCSQLLYQALKDAAGGAEFVKPIVIPKTNGVTGVSPSSILGSPRLNWHLE